MSLPLEDSYRFCCRMARKAGTNFYVAFLTLPRAKREAVCVIYAFMRRTDDIADDAAGPEVAQRQLGAWRMAVAGALQGETVDEPILPALAEVVRRYGIERRYLFELLDGAEMDQHKTRFSSFDELYRYCYRVAGCVGLVVLPIFGYTDPTAPVLAEACGIAFQLTNILRDVKEDAVRGRIYLPAEDMRRFGVEETDIMQGRYTPEFVALMQFEAARARSYYAKAKPLLGMISADSRPALAVMMGVDERLHDKMEARGFRVFDGRTRLSVAEKFWIVLRNRRQM
ncbi:MAG: presqualene diphosphate synthase HpnD [Verrucomicrobiae bacterium]|nr:presqualene diphosphate synthase HpnD [Verrucomicrobiae bacterium]